MKSIKDMTDQEFEETFGTARHIAVNLMRYARKSILPDRAMHPNAKMIDEKLTIADHLSLREYLKESHIHNHTLRRDRYYKSSELVNKVSGEI